MEGDNLFIADGVYLPRSLALETQTDRDKRREKQREKQRETETERDREPTGSTL